MNDNVIQFAEYNRFFEKNGYLKKSIPSFIIDSMPDTGDVENWAYKAVDKIGFAVPRELAIDWLSEYEWDSGVLYSKTDRELSAIVLWLACGWIKTGQGFTGLVWEW